MPELAAAYAIGFLASLILTAIFYFLWSRYQTRPAARLLRENLKAAGVYWSDREDRIKEWSQEESEADVKKASTSLLATCAGLSFLSWAGFFFILLIMLSYRFLARSRFENRLFESPLASASDLPTTEVARILQQIRTEFPQSLKD
jgi:hypothetical protein